MNAKIFALGENKNPHIVGAKAATLSLLIEKGFSVPKGFVISAQGVINDEELLSAFDALKVLKVAVRSSALDEDSKKQSLAGQYLTTLNVNRKGLLAAVAACKQSKSSKRARSYGNPKNVAVIVQEMMIGQTSGVVFSKSPLGEGIYIEAVFGTCDKLTDGTLTPESYIVDGKKIQRDGKLLSDEQILNIAKTVQKISSILKYPVDAEWTIRDSELIILQARPIVVLQKNK